MSVCFVMSGGASLGSIQAGMLRALYERDVAPDVIVATSVGAVNGAYIASRPPTVATADELATIWRGVRRQDVFPFNPATALIGITGRRNYLIPNGPPVEWEDTELIDGGVANNTPISHALELGCDQIYVFPTGVACALPEGPHGALGMAIHAMSQLVHLRLNSEIAALAGDPRLVVLPPPCPITVQPVDFSRADELIEDAYREACHALDNPRRSRPAPAWPRPVRAQRAA